MLEACFDPTGAWTLSGDRCASVVLILTGAGVLSKGVDSSVAERVAAHPDEFLATRRGEEVTFVRRDRVAPLLEALAGERIYPAEVCCGFPAVEVAVSWRRLVRADEASSALAQAVVRRWALPELGTFLLLLGAATVARPRLQERARTLRRISTERPATDERRRAEAAFAERLGGYAALCDRIASCVAEEVTLTELDIEPLEERFAEGRPLVRRVRTIYIAGRAERSEPIAALARALERTPDVRRVRLASIERAAGGAGLQFRIEMEL